LSRDAASAETKPAASPSCKRPRPAVARSLHTCIGFRLPDHDAKQDPDGDDCREVAKVGHG
jgi:hypothetical protein